MKAITIVGIVFFVVGMVTLMFSGFPIPSKADSDRALSIAAIGAGIVGEIATKMHKRHKTFEPFVPFCDYS